jgi:glutaminase
MFKSRLQIKSVLTVTLIATSFLSVSVSAQTARSPVAPRRELVESVIREAYEKFRNDTNG